MSDQRDVQPGPHGAFGTSPSTESRPPAPGEGAVPDPSSPPSIDLITEATRVWGRYRRGAITYGQLECELKVIETRYARPSGDEIDRAWSEYKEVGP